MPAPFQCQPLLGDFKPGKFLLFDGAFSPVPFDLSEGDPRPGVLKWSMVLYGEATQPNQATMICYVQTPFVVPQSGVLMNGMTCKPLVTITPRSALVTTEQVYLEQVGVFRPDNLLDIPAWATLSNLIARVIIQVGAPVAGDANMELTIDFSHSAIN
jgi:hypothetical protein